MSLSSNIVDLKLSLLGYSPLNVVSMAANITEDLSKLPSLSYAQNVAKELDLYRRTEAGSKEREAAEARVGIALKLLAEDATHNSVVASQVKAQVKRFTAHGVVAANQVGPNAKK